MIAIAILLFILPLCFGGLLAQGERVGVTTYYFSDSGGNSVSTTSLNFAKKILRKTVLLLDFEMDNVTVPAITATTGATRPTRASGEPFQKTRLQGIIGIEQGIDANTSVAFSFYRSQEVDYVSNSLIGAITREYNEKNTTLTVKGQFIADQVGKILDDGSVVNQPKKTYSGAVGLSQILSPTTVLNLSYDGLFYDGFLSDPYRTVQVFDQNNVFTAVEEKHPDTRIRQAATGKLSQFLTTVQASVIGSYRFYFDDWDVQSHTFDIEFNKYVKPELIARVNYRFYTQGESRFYQDRYVGQTFMETAFRTADFKQNAFNSNNFGLSLTYMFKEFVKKKRDYKFLENASVEVRYFRYFNTQDFSANIFQLNLDLGI